jgi:uncharacterized BrkB/YihY/UPF0761 family membrane protein
MNRPLILALLSVIIVGALDFMGRMFDLYFIFYWYDILLHFMGGLAVTLIIVWLSRRKVSWWKISLIALCIAIGWEWFEYYFGIALLPGELYRADTSIDIVMDCLGIALALFVSKKHIP